MKLVPVRSPEVHGLWAVAKEMATGGLMVQIDGFNSRKHAQAYISQKIREHQRKMARIAPPPASPYDRRIPAGFYTDKDAA